MDAVRLFSRLSTQWQTQIVGTAKRNLLLRSGLRYEVLPVVAGALGLTLDADLFDRVRIMEATALEIFLDRARR